MSRESNRAKYSLSRTDTVIGAGARVEGDISFTGVLRIQGSVLGNIACDLDFNGTIVVGKSGSVTGRLEAPHIVVGGHVSGPAHSAQSFEIQQGACLLGDTSYESIQIQAGGIIEGELTARAAVERDRLGENGSVQGLQSLEDKLEVLAEVDAEGLHKHVGRGRKLAGAIILFIGLAALVLLTREPMPVAPQVADSASKAASAANAESASQSRRVEAGSPDDSKDAAAAKTAPSLPSPGQDTQDIVQAPPSDIPSLDPSLVVTIQGVNPGKPAGFFSVISKEPSVMFRKQHEDPSDGTRIEIGKGATTSIAISKGEIFRVAEGPDLLIFYQGRKVGTNTIRSGTWMSFVPHSTAATGE